MNNMPLHLRKDLAADPRYRRCARKGLHGHVCAGRITWEHAIIVAGRQVQKKWAVVPLCAKAHAVDYHQDRGDMNKEINVWIALNQATPEELLEVSKAINYTRMREMLNKKYGPYVLTVYPNEDRRYNGINYSAIFVEEARDL